MSTVTMKIWSAPVHRGPRLMKGVGVTSNGEQVDFILVGGTEIDQVATRLVLNAFVKVSNAQVKPDIDGQKTFKLTSKSRVFLTAPFAVDDELETNFFQAPFMSIAEALASPPKQRLSLKGKVVNVSPVRTGDGWTRRDIDVEDRRTSRTIRCKLWGGIGATAPALDENIIITNCVTQTFRDQVSVNATHETTISTDNAEIVESAIEMTGYSIDSDPVDIITVTDDILTIDMQLFEEAIGDINTLQQRLPLRAIITTASNNPSTIISITL